ncbi:hypothetical protein [Kineosporia sp. R_H_3]|uniref:hypothetical protein n=1 Tax=Kineosporia sp. R_H_3 TaxID=1961848 RepID=UPI0018EA269D|nr:hypothetical protein [Kineosporia sp. R_H_3]
MTSTDPNTNPDIDTGKSADRPLSSPIVAALEQAWTAIQARHPQIPDVVIVLASGSVGAPRGALKLGHFAAMRWTHAEATEIAETVGASGSALGEVFVGGEGLALGAVDVLGTLLHEATHALAHVRGVKDCSRQGRYHNRKFRDLAEELGLDVREVPVIGWSDTHVPAATRDEYAATLTSLTAALTLHRRAEGGMPVTAPDDEAAGADPSTGSGSAGPNSSRNGAAARCGCGRRIRVTASVLALGPITCGLCGQPFSTSDTDTPDACETNAADADRKDPR